MPKKSKFGSMPPLELLKLWVDNGFWYVAGWVVLTQAVRPGRQRWNDAPGTAAGCHPAPAATLCVTALQV
jgi:hypothetical protein